MRNAHAIITRANMAPQQHVYVLCIYTGQRKWSVFDIFSPNLFKGKIEIWSIWYVLKKNLIAFHMEIRSFWSQVIFLKI